MQVEDNRTFRIDTIDFVEQYISEITIERSVYNEFHLLPGESLLQNTFK